jgi:hypothetical protein
MQLLKIQNRKQKKKRKARQKKGEEAYLAAARLAGPISQPSPSYRLGRGGKEEVFFFLPSMVDSTPARSTSPCRLP